MARVAGVYINDWRIYDWLRPLVADNLEDYVYYCWRIEGREPSVEELKREARRLVERLLSLKAGRPVSLGSRSWAYWAKILLPHEVGGIRIK
jgi:hypothetical protein